MKESLNEQAMLNSLVADYLCSKAPKIGAKFKVDFYVPSHILRGSTGRAITSIINELTPQKDTSACAWEGSAGLSEMVQHYLKTANDGKSEEKEGGKQNGEPASGVPNVGGKKEKCGEKKGKKTGKKVAAPEDEAKAPKNEVKEKVKVKPKKGSKRKVSEGDVTKAPAEVKIDEKVKEVENSAGVETKKKPKKEQENRKEAEKAALNMEASVKANEAVEEAPKSKKKKSKKAENVESAAAVEPNLEDSKKKKKKKSSK